MNISDFTTAKTITEKFSELFCQAARLDKISGADLQGLDAALEGGFDISSGAGIKARLDAFTAALGGITVKA